MALHLVPRDVRPWTVMVFMASDTDLELYAQQDLEEMQKIGSVPGRMHVVVQVARRRFKHPARFYIREGRRDPCSLPTGPKSTGNPAVLANFLSWARRTCQAERYMLVLWGHAFGLGYGRNYGDALTICEIGDVLARFARTVPNGKLDVLGCDACSMSKAEATYQFRNSVDILIASQTSIPYFGWPYESLLTLIARNRAISPENLATTMVQRFVDSYRPPEVMLSAVNLESGSQLDEVLDSLSHALIEARKTKRLRDRIDRTFQQAASANGFERPLVDLGDLCREFAKKNLNRDITAAARATRRTLRAVIGHRTLPAKLQRRFHGLGIYVPLVTRGSFLKDLDIGRNNYRKLDLMKRTAWDDVVFPSRTPSGASKQ
jgi:hypothetical protein